jgi:hypothetical protein
MVLIQYNVALDSREFESKLGSGVFQVLSNQSGRILWLPFVDAYRTFLIRNPGVDVAHKPSSMVIRSRRLRPSRSSFQTIPVTGRERFEIQAAAQSCL